MPDTADRWFTIRNADEIDSPALVVYTDRVRANIAAAVELAGDPGRLRPHVKTHKSPDVVRLQLQAGITRFKCATIAEAEMLARAGAPDVLLAYQPVGPKVFRLLELTRKYPRTLFACLVDDPSAAAAIASAFAGEPEPLRIYLDLDVGMHRTGIVPGPAAISLYRECGSLAGIRPAGLHAYDGHIEDRDPAARCQRCDSAFAAVQEVQAELLRLGSPLPAIIAGGSPTFAIHARRRGIECSPGTFVYWDKSYLDLLPDQPFLPAALVVSRVISRPRPSRPGPSLVCLDLGHKSVAAEKELGRRVFFPDHPSAVPVSQSEEHLLLSVEQEVPVGTVLYGIPYHICPTCALYERAITIRDGQADGEWRIEARDRRIGV